MADTNTYSRTACQTYNLDAMVITWLDEQYWKTVHEETPPSGQDLPSNAPLYLFPCKNTTLPSTYAKLSSVCWFDVRALARVRYPCRAKLLMCIKTKENYNLGELNVVINVGIKNGKVNMCRD